MTGLKAATCYENLKVVRLVVERRVCVDASFTVFHQTTPI